MYFSFFLKHIVEESRLGSIYAGKGIVVLGPTSRCYLTLRVPPSVCFASDSSIYSLLCSSSIPVLVPFLRVLLLALYIWGFYTLWEIKWWWSYPSACWCFLGLAHGYKSQYIIHIYSTQPKIMTIQNVIANSLFNFVWSSLFI